MLLFFRCYVDKSCPGALSDFRNPSLYLSYEACSDDQDTISRCHWKQTQSSCQNGTSHQNALLGSESTDTKEITLSTVLANGVATFTDLGSVNCGLYSLIVEARPPSGPLIWKFTSTIGIRPAFASKMVVITPPKGALPGLSLLSQPRVQLTDNFGNTVFDDKICTAVTASVSSWSGKSTSPIGIQSPKRYIYGQITGDDKLYPYGCSTDPNLLCR